MREPPLSGAEAGAECSGGPLIRAGQNCSQDSAIQKGAGRCCSTMSSERIWTKTGWLSLKGGWDGGVGGPEFLMNGRNDDTLLLFSEIDQF